MNLFIPDIGTLLKLDEDWTFTLYNEYRNKSLGDSLNKHLCDIGDPKGNPNYNFYNSKNQVIDLPKDLVIKIDRIYIRKGLSQYSSITFTVPKPKTKKDREQMPKNIIFGGSKFWVKLHECNGMQLSPVYKNLETTELFQKLYYEIDKDASTKFGVDKCTKMMAQINKLLGTGQNINNFATYLRYDQFLNKLIFKIKEDSFLSDYLTNWLKSEIRDFKLKQLSL